MTSDRVAAAADRVGGGGHDGEAMPVVMVVVRRLLGLSITPSATSRRVRASRPTPLKYPNICTPHLDTNLIIGLRVRVRV